MQRLDLTPCKLLHLNMECYKYIILPVILPNKSFKEQTNLKRKHTKKSLKKKKKIVKYLNERLYYNINIIQSIHSYCVYDLLIAVL